MSIDSEEAAIRTVIAGVLVEHAEAGGRGIDALHAMRQAEAIVKVRRETSPRADPGHQESIAGVCPTE
jgi:hypothetical protein